MIFNPTLSIIIVNFNTRDLLRQCLASLFKNDRRLGFNGKGEIPSEIIVVDNGSTDGSKEFLKNQKVKVIFNKKNLGFAKANNQAMKIARGEFILLLNSDTIINEAAISQTILWLSNHPRVGAVSCKLINQDKSTQPSGGFFPNLVNLFCWAAFLDDLPLVNRMVKPYHPHPREYRETRELDWITGAFFMIRKAVVREIGGFNEEFFMYVEELEWCYRIKKSGWQVYFYNGAKIIHLGGRSGKSETAILGEDRGLVKFFNLHKPAWQQPFLHLILLLKNVFRWLFFGIIRNDEKKKKVFGTAIGRCFLDSFAGNSSLS